ncbi:hypothetical protein CDL15_Pgr027890 [Punica granatum]|uniref:Nitrate regulatory gene2 protein-like n=1 Tax=Punica granatum TaxID=22663 RepID=A0A218XJG4_PUNGR|nr:hypothetical protein CDL15_Pgr027890 [Punica granatum]
MGCGGSKVDDLRLVTLCRERKELIRAAADHRYELAAAHVLYFQSLTTVGEALRKFVEEELVIGTSSGSSPGSPVLTLPSDDRKPRKPSDKVKNSSSSTSISHNAEGHIEGSHLHLSGSDSESELSSDSGHIHIHDSPISKAPPDPGPILDPGPSTSYGYNYPPYPYPYPYPYSYPPGEWGMWNMAGEPVHSEPRAYYMKKSSTPMKSVIFEEPGRHSVRENEGWSGYGSSGYPQYGNGGYFGYPMMDPAGNGFSIERERQERPPPAPPSPPNVSAWDFLNVFQTYDNGYPGYYPKSGYGVGSMTSSPDSKEVREREGIPDLEDETENEMVKDVYKETKKPGLAMDGRKNLGEGPSRAVPSKKNEGASTTLPSHNSEASSKLPSIESDSTHLTTSKEINSSSSETIISKSSSPEGYTRKGVSFEVEEAPTVDIESSNPSSLTSLSAHGTRDLQEVVREIKNEFETASNYGKEVAVLLEVGKLPYRSKDTIFKDATKDFNMKSGNISTTLEKLYVWEKKLYKEIKDEEKLRVVYEKKCKKLKTLDDRGAEPTKIDATQATVRKLHTKIDICIRTVDAISSRIHKLRDDELQPQLTELIHGLIRMWRSMFKCHQKQFRAIMESKARSMKANTGLERESSLRATVELEAELLKWCNYFNQWVNAQKSYVESLNEWLLRCLHHEPEETADGVAPFSPSRIGAPPIFVICHDWFQAMERISQERVANAMSGFASKLHQLWERQDEEQQQRIKAEFASKDLEKQLRILRMEKGRLENHQDSLSDKTAMSKLPSDSGVSRLDDLKVDLDSMRKKLEEERARHRETKQLVHHAASNSLQAGLLPIFETLENFTSEVLKGYEQVRLDG